ncbi:DM13 domain-containing protein [Salinibacterium sp. ZJ450]|uniref:DM13 domain-containing protein n=1 Tax=Salinibacterium sp. ZJ450 TaxID=2708338 RepID=UPI00141FF27C|nr:DM13 domain-containing protein [Salinibacterium sp. ZJ450]
MRIYLRLATALVLAGIIAVCSSGCSGADPSDAGQAPTSMATPSEAATQEAAAGLSEFEQQLPITGQFVNQWTETVGSVEIARRDNGTVWVTLTDFRTGSAPDLRLYLNEGALIKNSDDAWTTDVGARYELAGSVSENASVQEFEVPGAHTMDEIHSVTVRHYAAPDFPAFGSAPLS